jgi:hypothetical protein
VAAARPIHNVNDPAPAESENWVITDAAGFILDLGPSAASLLNLSARGARGRSLPAFFTENRPRLLQDLLRAADGVAIERVTMLQPRDRRARRIRVDLSAQPTRPGDRVQVRWVMTNG